MDARARSTRPLAGKPLGSATTASYSERIEFSPAISKTETVAINSTQVIGRLIDGPPLYDQTFSAAFDSAIVRLALQAASQAVAAADPGATVGPVILTEASRTTATSLMTTYSRDTSIAPVTHTNFELAVGGFTRGIANSVTTGVRSSCQSALAALPSISRPACTIFGGAAFIPAPGTTNTNVISETTYTVDQVTLCTLTTNIFEQYTITGG